MIFSKWTISKQKNNYKIITKNFSLVKIINIKVNFNLKDKLSNYKNKMNK